MIFNFKPKKIVVDAFTWNVGAYEYAPVKHMKKCIPSEFKKHPNTYISDMGNNFYTEHSTMKGCVGLINLFTTGIALPLWSDMSIDINDKGGYRWTSASDKCGVESHSREQMWKGFYSDWTHIKLISPWALKEKTGVKFMWSHTDYHNCDSKQNIKILQGILDFKYNNATHPQLMIKNDTQWHAKAGDILAHIVPLSEKDVVIKTHLVSKEEYERIHVPGISYRKNYMIRKSIKDKKCPFGFGK